MFQTRVGRSNRVDGVKKSVAEYLRHDRMMLLISLLILTLYSYFVTSGRIFLQSLEVYISPAVKSKGGILSEENSVGKRQIEPTLKV